MSHFPRLAAILVISSAAGLVIGLGASFLVTPQFIATSELSLSVARPDLVGTSSLANTFMLLKTETTSRESLKRVIEDPRLDLYPKNRRTMPLEDVIADMRHEIRIEPLNHPGVSSPEWMAFLVQFRYPDPRKTRAVVQTLVTQFQENNFAHPLASVPVVHTAESDRIGDLEARTAAIERRLGVASPGPAAAPGPPDAYHRQRPELQGLNTAFNLAVLDPPTLARETSPNRVMFSLLGFASGLTAAFLVAFLRRGFARPVPLPA